MSLKELLRAVEMDLRSRRRRQVRSRRRASRSNRSQVHAQALERRILLTSWYDVSANASWSGGSTTGSTVYSTQYPVTTYHRGSGTPGTLAVTLGNLPAHDGVTVTFDLITFNEWGDQTPINPPTPPPYHNGHSISISAKENTHNTVLYPKAGGTSTQSFGANWTEDPSGTLLNYLNYQSYPNQVGSGAQPNPPGYGNKMIVRTDLDNDGLGNHGCSYSIEDSVYGFSIPLESAAPSFTLNFAGPNSSGLQEYFGIANLQVVPLNKGCDCESNVIDAMGPSSTTFGTSIDTGIAVGAMGGIEANLTGGDGGVGSSLGNVPGLLQAGSTILAAEGSDLQFFDSNGSSRYIERGGGTDVLTGPSGGQYVLTSADGSQTTYNDFSQGVLSGRVKSVTQPGGTATTNYFYDRPAAPVLSQPPGGSVSAATYFVRLTYTVGGVETAASDETSIVLASGNYLSVAAPPSVPGETAYHVYVGTSSNSETLQSTSGTPGSAWTMTANPSTGGAAYPTTGGTTGTLTEITRSSTSGTVTTKESFRYDYLVGTDPNAGKLQRIALARKVFDTGTGQSDASVAYAPVREADYAYYSGVSPTGGSDGDLQTAIMYDGNHNPLDESYYRYWNGTDTVGSVVQPQDAIKYVYSAQSYARLAAALPGGVTPLTATDGTYGSTLQLYADDYYTYDLQGQIASTLVAGAGSGGQGLSSYSYADSGNAIGSSYDAAGNSAVTYNTWATKTVKTGPDGTVHTTYYNADGGEMLAVVTDPVSGKMYGTFTEYNAQGLAILVAQPSAVQLPASLATLEQYADLLNNTGSYTTSPNYQYLSNNSGLITVTDYPATTTANTSTAGDVVGYASDTQVKQGQYGVPIKQESEQYIESPSTTVFPIASDSVYPNTDGSTGVRTTSYTYTWFPGGSQMQTQTTSKPVVGSGQNGPGGAAETTTQVFDAQGRVTYEIDPDGYVTQTSYDPLTGAAVKNVTDAAPYAANVMMDGPVGYWRLGESSGTTASDSSGNSNSGTHTGTVTLAQSGALTNDSDTASLYGGGYTQIGNPTSLQLFPQISLEAWVKTTQPADSTNQPILTRWNSSTSGESWYLGKVGSTIALYPALSTASNVSASFTLINDGNWHQVVGVADDSGRLYLYVDGVIQATSTWSTTATGAADWRIGGNQDVGGEVWHGSIDEAAIYDHPLLSDRVAAHYSAGEGTIGQRTHLALTTTMQVDALGRTTKLTSPAGNVTYTVYNDANHEQRVYPGWQLVTDTATSSGAINYVIDSHLEGKAAGTYIGYTLRITAGLHDVGSSVTITDYDPSTGKLTFSPNLTNATSTSTGFVLAGTTGPIQVTREYRPAANAPAGQQTSYNESLTTSAAPSIDATGAPTGSETIDQTNLQSLTRQILNSSGQVAESDVYSNFVDLLYSTQNAHLLQNFSGSPAAVPLLARTDLMRQGGWAGTYGSQGYNVGGTTSWPTSGTYSYLASAPTMPSTGTWGGSDSRLLTTPGGGSVSTTYYVSATAANANFTIDLNMTDAVVHQISLYMVDWDNSGRNQRVDVLDPTSGAVLDTVTVSSFSAGQYVSFSLQGHVQLKFTNLAGASKNAVLSGIFFDHAGTYYPTLYGYDAAGRQNRVQEPSGTIQDTFFNGLGEPLSQWTGTCDLTTNGLPWSPTNNTAPSNMLDQKDNVYDQTHDYFAAPSTPSLTAVSGGNNLPATTYYVKITYVGPAGETIASMENSVPTAAGQVFTVTQPSSATGATGYNVYVSTSSGAEQLQTPVPVPITTPTATNWTLPSRGLFGVFSSSPETPVLSESGTGATGPTTYYVVVTYLGPGGESVASAESSVTVHAGNQLVVTSPSTMTAPSNATKYNVYVSTSEGAEVLQTATGATALGTNWSAYVSGLATSMVPPAAPTVSYTSPGGTLPYAITYYVTVTYVGTTGETLASAEASCSVPANDELTVATPAPSPGATSYNIYVGTSSGSETLQNSIPIALGGSPWALTGNVLSNVVGLPVPADVGDGNLTQTTLHPGSAGGGDRANQFLFDFQDRNVAEKDGVLLSSGYPNPGSESSVHRPIFYTVLDNLGEAIQTYRYDGDGVRLSDFAPLALTDAVPTATDLGKVRQLGLTSYDDQGRAYYSSVLAVNQSTGLTGVTSPTTTLPALFSEIFYDHRGNVIATFSPGGGAAKSVFDGAGRLITQFTTDGGVLSLGSLSAALTWSNAATVSNDVVLNEQDFTYDGDSNVIFTVNRDRFDSDSNGSLGALGSPASGIGARDSYLAAYFDAADRPTFSVDYGTAGGAPLSGRPGAVSGRTTVTGTATASGSGTTLVDTTHIYPDGSFVGYTITITGGTGSGSGIVTAYSGGTFTVYLAPGTSNAFSTAPINGTTYSLTPNALVTETDYNLQGLAYLTIDPRGLKTLSYFDAAGMSTESIEDWDGSSPAMAGSVLNIITNYTHDGNGNLLTMQAVMPSGTPNQTTQYVYGVGASGGLFSNDLILRTQYPIKSGSAAGLASAAATDDQILTYDQLGEKVTYQDQNGSVHTYSYDVLGRQYRDSVTTLGSGVNGSVRLIVLSFDTAGRLSTANSYADTSGITLVNSVTDGYNTLGDLTSEAQSHPSDGDSGTVSYGYSLMSGGANNDRPTSITYPNGRMVYYNYGGASGLDGAISRVSALLDNNNTTHLEDYTYLGVSTIVQRSHPEVTNTLTLSYITAGTTGASGDQYTGLDSFGRVIDQYFSINSGATTTDRFQYGYDQDSNVLYKKNAGPNGGSINASTMSELYHVNSSATGDNATAYDGLNRLTDFARGTLSASGNNGTSPDTINTPATSSNWHLDALGNWTDSSSVASGTTGTDLTTAKTLGTAQNAAASGWYGEQITVATTDDLAVTQLGRIFITGNSSSHTVKIVDAATGLDVPGASVSVPTGGTNGQFTFVTLNRPVTLLAGHSYYVVSQETSGGDQWYDSTTTVTTTTAVSAKVSASYVASTWSTGSSGHSYGPVDLKYVAALARTTNSRNQVTAVGFSVTYDNNGNLTSDQNGYQRIYDAWNRLTFATGPGTPTTYTYDALGRNTTSIQCTGTGSDSYYSSSWQDLEDDSFVPAGSGGGHTAVASDQFVWGQGYVDDLVLRDHTPAGSGTTRLYAQQDANYNVTALVNTSGTVVQRFDYDPYGTATVLTAGWATTTDAYAWKYRFQGLAYDSNSGLYNGRNRTYSPTLGRWMQMDPAGYVDGMNLYQLTESAPTTLRDPMGLDSAPDDPLALPPYNPRGLTPWELSLANSDVVDKGIQVGLKLYSKKLISQVEDQLRSETDHYGFSQVDYLDLRGKLDGAAGPLAAHLWDEFQLSPLGNFETGVNNQVNQFLLSGFDTLGRDLLHLDSRPGNKAGDRADVHANITDTLFSSVFGDLRIEVCGYKAEAERTQRFFDQKNSSKDYIGYVGPELGFYWNLATQKNPPIRFTPSLGYDSSTQSIGGGIDASVDLLSLVPQLRNVPGLTSAKFGGDFFDINNKEKWDVKAELQFKF